MTKKIISNVIGIDDSPFEPSHRGDVKIVGACFANTRFEGILVDKVRRDGNNATDKIIHMLTQSRFFPQLQAILLQGIAFAGFNVIDIQKLSATLDLPVLVISRKQPNMKKIHKALIDHVPSGKKKWQLIEQAGPLEKIAGVYTQNVGLNSRQVSSIITKFAIYGKIPEPIRTAHIVAGGLVYGHSHGRA